MPRRFSYKGLMSKPAWGLYLGDKLVATVRADSKYEARSLFKRYGVRGADVGVIKNAS